jgi:radical SAM protein with 4Fe4S-binding SPASM domain
VTIANVMMRKNLQDSDRVHDLAKELGVNFTVDPTITPRMDGNTDLLRLRIPSEDLKNVFQNSRLVGNVEEFCAPPKPVDDSIQEGLPCSAGHTMCYISPYGDLFPCVQFPLPSGNIRLEKFSDIWRNSQQLREVRSIHARDLPVCSSCSHLGTCTRCPGLAYMEGNMRGHSTADCEKSLARTGIVPASMLLQPMMEQNLNFRVFPPTP